MTFYRVLSKTRGRNFANLTDIEDALSRCPASLSRLQLRREIGPLSLDELVEEGEREKPGLSLAELKELERQGERLNRQFDFSLDLHFIQQVLQLVQAWQSVAMHFLDHTLSLELQDMDRVLRVSLTAHPHILGLPFLESLTLALTDEEKERLHSQRTELRNKVQIFDALFQNVTMIEKESRAWALPLSLSLSNTSSAGSGKGREKEKEREKELDAESVSLLKLHLHKEVLSLLSLTQQLVVLGTQRGREREGAPLPLRHWGDADVDFAAQLVRKLQLVWEKLGGSEAEGEGENAEEREGEMEVGEEERDAEEEGEREFELLTKSVLAKCLSPSSSVSGSSAATAMDEGEREVEGSARKRSRRGEKERDLEREKEEEDAAEEDAQEEVAAVKGKRRRGGASVGGGEREKETVKERETVSTSLSSSLVSISLSPSLAIAVPLSAPLNRRDEFSRLVHRLARCQSLSPSDSVCLSSGMQAVVQYWLQVLAAFLARLAQARDWKRRLQALLPLSLSPNPVSLPLSASATTPLLYTVTSSAALSRANLGESVRLLVREAEERGIRSEERERVQDLLSLSDCWLARVKAVLGLDREREKVEGEKGEGEREREKEKVKREKGEREKEKERESKMKLEPFKDFVKVAEREKLLLILAEDKERDRDGEREKERERGLELLTRLKKDLRKANEWFSLFEAFQAQQAQSQAQTQSSDSVSLSPAKASQQITVDELTHLASSLSCVDVQEELDSLSLSSQLYCLCRQIYFGQMVGCDLCDDWFHLSCIGLTQAQVDKSSSYHCLRCSLKQSQAYWGAVCGETVNKWSSVEEHFKQRDHVIGKYTRRIVRDCGEVEKVKKALDGSTHHARPPLPLSLAMSTALAPSNNAGNTVLLPPPNPLPNAQALSLSLPLPSTASSAATADSLSPSPSLSVSVSAAVAVSSSASSKDKEKEKEREALRQKLLDLQAAVEKERTEHQRLQSVRALELSRQAEIRQWMSAAQRLLWPDPASERERERGDILCSLSVSPADNHSREDYAALITDIYNRLDKEHAQGLYSEGALDLVRLAVSLGVQEIEDVKAVLDQLQWLAWCALALQALRHPAPTALLRRFVARAQSLRAAEENKVVKTLSLIAGKASAWKARARRFKLAVKPTHTARKAEEGKLQTLVLEGNNLPFVSRLKPVYGQALDALKVEVLVLEERERDGVSAVAAEEKDKGSRRKGQTQKGSGASIGGVQTASSILAQDLPCSSDEEERETAKEREREKEGSTAMDADDSLLRSPAYWARCYPADVHTRTAASLQSWPVQLSIARKPISLE
jgi:hypothetical protein